MKAKRTVPAAYGKGLISGNGSKLAPDANVERCQIAAILQRFIEAIAK